MSKKSIASLELAHSIAPDNRRILLYLAIGYEIEQKYDQAIEAYAKLVMLDPNSLECIEKVLQLAKKFRQPTMQARFEMIKSFRNDTGRPPLPLYLVTDGGQRTSQNALGSIDMKRNSGDLAR